MIMQLDLKKVLIRQKIMIFGEEIFNIWQPAATIKFDVSEKGTSPQARQPKTR